MVDDFTVAEIPSARQVVVIGCAGHRHLLNIIDRRFVRWRCTQKRCRQPGMKTFHIADSLTGRLVRTEYEQMPDEPAHQGV